MMNHNRTIPLIQLFLCFFFLTFQTVKGQKVDTDSLLTVVLKDMKSIRPDYKTNIQRALLGKKLAPDYLDFYLVLGRNYDLTKAKDSARFYYNYVIDKSPKYEDAYLYLINIDLEVKNYDNALVLTDKAIESFPDNKTFRLKRIAIYSLQNDAKNEEKELKSIRAKYPNDADIEQRLFTLYSKTNIDRAGAYYNYTTIDRDGVGPWHLVSADYMRQRTWGSIIGKVSYAKRLSSSLVMASGLQFEVESYLSGKKNNYSYIDVAYSKDSAFPEWRLGYSYFYNFNKGWEADLGFRFIEMQDNSNLKTLNVGLGKYFGSYWVNLRSYIQKDGPSFTLTSRYYYGTKLDYITVIAGYGTSPDDQTRSAEYQNRASLSSYRLSAGFYKLIKNHYIFGLLITDNQQEYTAKKFQNELDFAFILQYKF